MGENKIHTCGVWRTKFGWAYAPCFCLVIFLWCHSVATARLIKVKISRRLTKYHAMQTYWGSGSIVPRILNFGTRWSWVVSFTTHPLYPQYPMDKRMGGPQNRSGSGGKEKKPLPLSGIEPRWNIWIGELIFISISKWFWPM